MKLALAYLFILFFLACSVEKPSYETIHTKAEKLNSNAFIGMPVSIKLSNNNDLLWVSDFRSDFLVYGINKKTGNIEKQLALHGNGPSEMLPPVQIFTANDSLLYLYDRHRKRLYNYIKTDNSLNLLTSFDRGCSLVHKINDSTYLGSGHFDKRFSLMNKQGQELSQICEMPSLWANEKTFSKGVLSMYHQIIGFSNNSNGSLLAACTSDILSIYSVSGNSINEVCSMQLHDYEYDSFSENDFISAKRRKHIPYGIMDLTSDDNYIYVLYDQNSQSTTPQISAKSEIRMYNWHGVLKKKIVTDVVLSIITIDVTENIIYGIDEESVIWKIKL